jgi:hypothetical protein
MDVCVHQEKKSTVVYNRAVYIFIYIEQYNSNL